MPKIHAQEIKARRTATILNQMMNASVVLRKILIISLLPANHSLSPGLLKGRFFNALGTRCFSFATTKSLECIGTVSLELGINSGTCCFSFATTKSLEVIGTVSLDLGINSVPWSVDVLGNN